MHKSSKLFVLLLASVVSHAQIGGSAKVSGGVMVGRSSSQPDITQVEPSTSASTISTSFHTSSVATPSLACGTTSGTYDHVALDSEARTGLTHEQIVTGLAPSTEYYCQITAGSQTSAFTASTIAQADSTPITGLSVGTPTNYNDLNSHNSGSGDTYYNCTSSDDVTYVTADDTFGFRTDGFDTNCWDDYDSSCTPNSPMSIGKFDNGTVGAWQIETTNYINGYGVVSTESKNTGLWCMEGKLFMVIGKADSWEGGAIIHSGGQVIWSADHGRSWNNFQTVNTFAAAGAQTSPSNAQMFPGSLSTMGTAEFIHYCADDGTLGYADPCSQHDGGDAYVYLIANEGVWNGGGPTAGGGNDFYIARIPRVKLQNLNGADYEYFKGGDGSQDTNWSSDMADAVSLISNTGALGEPSVQYIPALNRYLLLTFFYPLGLSSSSPSENITSTTWLGYEAPHPWGPWTLIYSSNWSGAYNPVFYGPSAWAGTTPTIMFTGDFAGWTGYNMRYATLNISTTEVTPPPCDIAGTHTITDCFTTVQDPISTPWTSATASGYVTAKTTGTGAKASDDTNNSIVVYTSGTASNDQEATITYGNSSGTGFNGLYTGPCVHMDTSGNGYCWLVNQGSVYVLTSGSGGSTAVSGCPGRADGHVFQLEIVGTTLTCRDLTAGTSASGTSAAWMTGRIGFLVANASDSTNQVNKFGGTQ
jgi:hypothetical protein